MKKFFVPMILSAFMATSVSAKLLRVGYNGLPLSGVDFSNLKLAHDAATAGDTIQIYGSAAYTVINKKLVLMGFGYNLDTNPGLQAIGTNFPSYAEGLVMGAGSDGSIVTGIGGAFAVGDPSGAHTAVANITFQRCFGSFIFYNHVSYGPISNIKIISCVINNAGMNWNGDADYPVVNVQVYNSIIGGGFNMYKNGTSIAFVNCVSSAGEYGNFLYLREASALVKNCILGYSNYSVNVNTVFDNNFFMEANPGTVISGSNNHWSQDYSVLFTRNDTNSNESGYPNSSLFDEDYFVLKPGSPAIGAARDASGKVTNCGIYGGEAAYIYQLSGVPAVPAIYKLSSESNAATSNPYNVTISIKSHN